MIMHIKQIIIQGFKSYRDQIIIDELDRGHNVVIGRNGSGKSNFFAAIQFVLSDEFCHLKPEQRQCLLHEGTGQRSMSTFVEMIFDNSDNRVPIESTEIHLRRTLGTKKDQYFMNKKLVTRSEVTNLMETAGFSSTNPYYIVKQGKVNQMAIANDSYRLQLLREVAGTKTYDEKREESIVILRDSESKSNRIQDYLKTIDERLETLNKEKEELSSYQLLDKKKRVIEYIILEKELDSNKKKLNELENERKQTGQGQQKFGNDLKKAIEDSKKFNKEIRDLKKSISSKKEERDTLNSEIQQAVKEKSKLRMTKNDLIETLNGEKDTKKRAEDELKKLSDTIEVKERELEELKPKYEQSRKEEEEIVQKLVLNEQKRKELCAKQGRRSQFSSKEARDNWIREELTQLEKQIKEKAEHAEKVKLNIQTEETKRINLDNQIEKQSSDSVKLRQSIEDQKKQLHELKRNRDNLHVKRNDIWKKESNQQQNLVQLKDDLIKIDQTLRSMVGKGILNGRDSVHKVLETFRNRIENGEDQCKQYIEGYYGSVIELFQSSKDIYTAVEVTAGNKLFFHVVKTDHVGTAILKEMNQQHLPGEVNFMPLNRLSVKTIGYPDHRDAVSMISKLVYEPNYDKAMRYIFGRTLICRNLEAATKIALEFKLDCVTLDGDQVSSKGPMTGGYFNTSRSRLEIQNSRSLQHKEIQECEKELAEISKKLREVLDKIAANDSEIQKIELKNTREKANYDKLLAEIRVNREEISNIERNRDPKERSLNQCLSHLEVLKLTKDGYDSELNQELSDYLSTQDQAAFDDLNDVIQKLKEDSKKAFTIRSKLEADKNKLENLLQNNLKRRKAELDKALQDISDEDRHKTLANCTVELERIEQKVNDCSTELERVETELKDFIDQLKSIQQQSDKVKKREEEIKDQIDNDVKSLEKFASQQSVLQQKIQDNKKKIEDLGTMPAEDLYNDHKKNTLKTLLKHLEHVNADLKKYSHVNKKALEQFIMFSDQKEKLVNRKKELDQDKTKIEDLVDLLEQRKREDIEVTYNSVSNNFVEVFKTLVPDGKAKLVMITNRNEEYDHLPQNINTDQFTGIGIRVSFTDQEHEMRDLNQLSGGQKSLVALTMIFAIQKCDPAPFYLFDEIDAALDPAHRRSVAKMIHELSADAQFITITFKPELLEFANKFYGVKYKSRVSHIECVSKEDALDFVEQDDTEPLSQT